MRIKSNQKGFTLVELLVVMAIIGLLIGLALAGLNVARQNQRDTARKSIVNDTRTALENYYGQNGTYPANANLTATGTKVQVGTAGSNGAVTLDETKNNLQLATAATCAGTESNQNTATLCYATGNNATAYALAVKLEGSATEFCVQNGTTNGNGGGLVTCP